MVGVASDAYTGACPVDGRIVWPTLTQRIADLECEIRMLKAERDALLLEIGMLQSERDSDCWKQE